MRPIKFRGKVDTTWWYATPDDDGWDQFWALVDRNTVGQFTGLKDKNGREIYESDVLRNYEGILWKVQWNEEKAEFELSWAGGPQPVYYRSGMHLVKDTHCEVRGDIP